MQNDTQETKEINHKEIDKLAEIVNQEIKNGWKLEYRYLDRARNEFIALLTRAKRADIGSKE